MGWRPTGTPKVHKITAKLAKEFCEMEAVHTDRPLSERRLNIYRHILDAGGFRPVTWARAYCEETNQIIRLNGKHTSTLFSSVDLSKYQDLHAIIEDYECDTLEDVAKLYATFDSQTQARTAGDVNRSFAAVVPELRDAPLPLINLFVSALNYNPTEIHGRSPKPAAERAEELFDNIDVCQWLWKMFENQSGSRHLQRAPVTAVMIASWRKAKQPATEFWKAVRDETGGSPDLPDRKLARFLLTTSSIGAGNRSGRTQRFRIQSREYYVRSVKAWNAWRKSEPTDLKYFHEAKIPVVI